MTRPSPVSAPWIAHYPPGLPPEGDYPAFPLWGFIERGARRRGEKVALVDGEKKFTYLDLWGRVCGAAGWFRKRGAEPGDRVLLRMANTASSVVAFYGALRAGCVVVPSSPRIGLSELSAQIADSEARIALGEDEPVGFGVVPRAPPDPIPPCSSTRAGRPDLRRPR